MTRLSRLPLACAAAIYGGSLFWTLPRVVGIWNDDFGYLRSVVETLHRGRPWTDDWLEPWAASLSIFSAAIYTVTHNFHLATYGLLGVGAATAFLGLGLLAESRRVSRWRSILFATVVLTFPTLYWKQLEFTGIALHLPCLFFAIWAANHRRWGTFTVVWVIAIANRQSALLWGALPGIEVVIAVLSRTGRVNGGWRQPLLSIIAGCGSYAALSATMNVTYAHKLVTAHLFDHIDYKLALGYLPLAVGCFYVSGGLIRLVGEPQSVLPSQARPRWWLVRAAGVIIGLWLLGLDFMGGIVSFEHPGFYDRLLRPYIWLLAFASMAGWWRRGFTFDPRSLFYAGAAFAFVALRADLWDYYLLDVAVFGFASLRPAQKEAMAEPARGPDRNWRTVAHTSAVTAAFCALLGFHARAGYRFKTLIDSQTAGDQLAERSLRSGVLKFAEIGCTNVGFMGWQLNPYFVSHDAKTDLRQIGFVGYLGGSRVVQITASSPRFRSGPFSPQVSVPAIDPAALNSDYFPEAWLFQRRYSLIAFPAPAASVPVPLNSIDFIPQRFPLNNEEWTKLIEKRLK